MSADLLGLGSWLPLGRAGKTVDIAAIILGDGLAGPSEIDPKYSQRNAQIRPLALPFAVHDPVNDFELCRISAELIRHKQLSTATGESPVVIHVRKPWNSVQSESIANRSFASSVGPAASSLVHPSVYSGAAA